MIKMLWLSRHGMTDNQIDDLHEIFTDDIQIDYCTEQVTSGEDVYFWAKDYDLLGIVLPIHIIGEFFELKQEKNWSIRVIHSVSNRSETGRFIINPAHGCNEKEYALPMLSGCISRFSRYWEKTVQIVC